MIGGRASWQLRKMGRMILVHRIGFSLFIPVRVASFYTMTAFAIPKPEHNQLFPSKLSSEFADWYNSRTRSNLTSTYDYNVKMGKLGRCGNVIAARDVFDEMSQRDAVSYASMISIYLKHDEFHKAEELFFEIPQGMRSIVSESAMVHAYAKAGRMDRAKEVFDEMPERNAFSWTSLISGYFKVGKVNVALKLFGEMPEREKNEVTWTNVIMGLARNRLIDEARVAFSQMPMKNVVAWTSIIKAYVENNRIEEALKLFNVMPDRNLYSWNILIGGLLDINNVTKAKELFDSMPWRNAISWTTMVTGLARNGMTDWAKSYFDQMPNKDISAWNAMITAYSNECRMVEAGELFKLMSNRNTITWNAIIDGYSKDRQEDEAFRHFILMLHDRIRPNETTLTSLLTSCGGIVGVLQVHGLIMHLGFENETSLGNCLITMYCKSGDFTSAHVVFDNLQAKDVVSWTSMILAYSNHGLGIQALQAFARMLRCGHKPDEVTFVGVLSACSHAGLVKKGQMLFDSIKTAYGLELVPEHYSCLVDMLGRAGLMKEAMNVVKGIPKDKYDGAILGALLGACRLHGDDDGLADYIGEELIELEPDSAGGYVLLGNVYAASEKWDKFSQLRKKMKERQVKKVPGFSQIEVNGKSHVFLVRDRNHPNIKKIYAFLHEKLLPLMQDTGEKIANLHAII